jgi:hydrogenase/urease accessory protein HupE
LNRRVLSVLLVIVAALLARPASAHAVGLSRGEYRVAGDIILVSYVFSGAELATGMPAVDADHDGRLSSSEVGAAEEALDRSIVRATRVRADGSPCSAHLDSAQVAEGDAVEVRASFSCSHPPRSVAIDCEFIDQFSASHRHLATVIASARETSFVLVPAQKRIELDLEAAKPPSATFGAMVWLGITHIATGYDHLAFLLGLLLLGGRPRTLIGVVTAFTVAHSITLGLAVLRVVSLRPSLVEPGIALSIVYVGIENLFAAEPTRRWRIAFPFGLLHGFGFAGTLTSLALPRASVPAALFGFNLGVEIGQLVVLAIVLPLVLRARREEGFRIWGVRILSVALSVAGCVWFVLRVGG